MKNPSALERRQARGDAELAAGVDQLPAAAAAAAGAVLRWEPVESIGDWRPDDYTVVHVACYRAKVPGGWLVALKGSYQAHGLGLTFYPDQLHAW